MKSKGFSLSVSTTHLVSIERLSDSPVNQRVTVVFPSRSELTLLPASGGSVPRENIWVICPPSSLGRSLTV